MLSRLLGTKVGMTQIFDESRNVVPVTVVDVDGWFVTQVKTVEHDGYSALQLGRLKAKHKGKEYSDAWLRNKKEFFAHVREVLCDAGHSFTVGQKMTLRDASIVEKNLVKVTGKCIGRGFQGVVKRWGFRGGPGAHGSMFHRIPGSVGNRRRMGHILKGKRLPGHMGCSQVTVRNLQVVKVDADAGCLYIKGAVPGKRDTLFSISKQG